MLPATLHLPYQDDCLAVVVLSTPSMFEQAFLPFMEENGCQGLTDPIDQCVRHHMSAAVEKVSLWCPNNRAALDDFCIYDTVYSV